MKKRIVESILFILTVGLLAGGCGKKNTEELPKETSERTEAVEMESETETEMEVVETHEGQAKSYLTGQWIDEELAGMRPVAVMTENTEITQPQYGLGKADVYYECPMEGGLTRMMVLYQDYSDMERIGNVRSCRNYFVYYAKEFDALYFHSGKSHFAEQLLLSDFIDNVDGTTGKGGAYYYRTSDRRAPHNLYTSTEDIQKAIETYGYRDTLEEDYTGHYQFAEDGEKIKRKDGEDALKVEVYYPVNHPWFEFNEEDGLYYRYQYGGKQVDALTNNQLAVSNIILQDCDVTLWEESTGYLYVDYMSGGTGKFITNGKCIDITWTKESETAPTRYFDSDGNEITLNQGKTWIEIVQSKYKDRHVISGKETN